MRLHTKNGNNIDTYDVVPNAREIREFKGSFASGDIYNIGNFLKFVATQSSREPNRQFRLIGDSKSVKEISVGPQCSFYWTKISPYPKVTEEQKQMLSQYFYGKLIDRPAFTTSINNGFYLMTNCQPQNNNAGENFSIENVLSLSHDLYLLHLLESGQFEKVTQEDIRRQLRLFDIKFLNSINAGDIEGLCDSGFIPITYPELIAKTDIGNKILEKKHAADKK